MLQEFYALAEKLANSSHLKQNESLLFCVLSHGFMKDGKLRVDFTDHESTATEHIISLFNNENCADLLRKPKIFIFPFCR